MKRAFTRAIALVFIGFLFIGGVNVVQNIMQNVHNVFYPSSNTHHILAYQ